MIVDQWPIASELPWPAGLKGVAHVRTLWFDAMNEFRIRDLVNLSEEMAQSALKQTITEP